jgi:signal transduction histidine kinase
MLGIRAGLASLGLMLVQAVAFHALTPISSAHGGVESRVVMLVTISLSAILLQQLCEESKDRLQQKNDQLKAGSDARTKFFNSLSHGTPAHSKHSHWTKHSTSLSVELRTPMHGIIAMSDELMKMTLSRCAQEAAEIVNECADHLLSLLDNILDFARIESGKLEFDNVLFDLPFKMGKTVNLLAAHAKNKQIVLEVTSDMTDPHRVGTVSCVRIYIRISHNASDFIKMK